MEHLKACGVRTIFIENYCYETLQGDLDQFISGGEGIKLPKILEAYLDYLQDKQKKERENAGLSGTFYSEKDLILAAKRVGGIRIVAIDREAALQAQSSPKERLLAFNYTAKQIIEAERGDGKYLVYTGAAHGIDALGVPGLGTLLGIPTLLIKDAQGTEFRAMVKGYETTFTTPDGNRIPLHFDFALLMDAPRKS